MQMIRILQTFNVGSLRGLKDWVWKRTIAQHQLHSFQRSDKLSSIKILQALNKYSNK